MPTVRVLLFASYADALGTSAIDLDMRPDARVRDVLAIVRDRAGAARVPPSPLVAVNATYAHLDDRLAERDEIAIIPPVAGGVMRVALVQAPIDVSSLLVEVSSPSSGATALFLGTVRDTNDGRSVEGIEYSAYEEMAVRELTRIAQEAVERVGSAQLVIVHRIGALALTDVSVAIAVSHARRTPALDAIRYIIEELKRRVPIWKREHYVDGTREWVDPTRSSGEVPR